MRSYNAIAAPFHRPEPRKHRTDSTARRFSGFFPRYPRTLASLQPPEPGDSADSYLPEREGTFKLFSDSTTVKHTAGAARIRLPLRSSLHHLHFRSFLCSFPRRLPATKRFRAIRPGAFVRRLSSDERAPHQTPRTSFLRVRVIEIRFWLEHPFFLGIEWG